MTKKLVFSLLLILSIVLFVGCGDDSAPESTGKIIPAAVESVPVEVVEEEVEMYSLDFTLVNHSGANLTEIRLSPVSDTSFGDNLLAKNQILEDGGSVDISFPLLAEAGTLYDMFTADDDGDTYQYSDLSLTEISVITLYWEKTADGDFTNYYVLD